MKFVKDVKIEINITEELINYLKEQYEEAFEEYENEDEALYSLFDELIFICSNVSDEINWEGIYELISISQHSKLIKS